jgi:APA family basic amino acid/polyamine antiporter
MATQSEGRIGLVECVAFAVGTMVGAGVFALSGVAVQDAGPAALVSFGLAAVIVLLSALSFAVVASLAKPGQSGYAYVGEALGGYAGFLCSWAFYLGGLISVAFVLNAFGQYLNQYFLDGLSPQEWALVAAVFLTLLNLGPASEVARIEVALVGIKLAILVVFIAFGLAHLGESDLKPFVPEGAHSIFDTTAILFLAYLGFNVVTNMAGDVKDPRRTVPRAILLSMGIVAVIYAGVVFALLASGIDSFGQASLGDAAEKLMGSWGGVLIPLAALISTLSGGNANVLGASEVMVRLAGDRQVPTLFGRSWHGHPVASVLLGGAVYTTLIAAGAADSVIDLANVAMIAAMALVNLAAIQAARRHVAGAIRLPLGPVLPAVALITSVVQLRFLGTADVAIGLGMVLAGTALYSGRDRLLDPVLHQRIRDRLDGLDGPLARPLRRQLGVSGRK